MAVWHDRWQHLTAQQSPPTTTCLGTTANHYGPPHPYPLVFFSFFYFFTSYKKNVEEDEGEQKERKKRKKEKKKREKREVGLGFWVGRLGSRWGWGRK